MPLRFPPISSIALLVPVSSISFMTSRLRSFLLPTRFPAAIDNLQLLRPKANLRNSAVRDMLLTAVARPQVPQSLARRHEGRPRSRVFRARIDDGSRNL